MPCNNEIKIYLILNDTNHSLNDDTKSSVRFHAKIQNELNKISHH